MQLYINNSWILNQVKEIWFNLEKEMQNLTENNLENIFWIEFIKSEFSLNNLRIDTLAFDNENNSFVIIEFKRWSSYSVIDQWFSYLSMLLNNKANFVHELWKNRNKFIDMNEIDWSQSKVIFIADSFTRYQKESINFKDLPIELYEIKQFNNWNIIYNPIIATNTTESIKTVTKFETTEEFSKIEKEIKTYDEYYHINWRSEKIIDIYNKLKEYILLIDSNIEISYKKMCINFKFNNRNIISMHLFVSSINIWLSWKYWSIKDEFWLIKDVSKIWNYWNSENEIKIIDEEKNQEIMILLKRVYENYKK